MASRRTRYRARSAMPSRVPPGPKETADGDISSALLQRPGCTARSPRAFCLPRWRNRDTRMSQKHEIPGSNPGWGTRFFCGSGNASAPPRQCDRNKRIVLLQLEMWQAQGRHSSTGRARRCQRRDVSSRLTGCPIGFRRLTVRTAAFQAANAGSIPAGNTTGM